MLGQHEVDLWRLFGATLKGQTHGVRMRHIALQHLEDGAMFAASSPPLGRACRRPKSPPEPSPERRFFPSSQATPPETPYERFDIRRTWTKALVENDRRHHPYAQRRTQACSTSNPEEGCERMRINRSSRPARTWSFGITDRSYARYSTRTRGCLGPYQTGSEGKLVRTD
jgi:hypothetical protein